ncbi:MAG: hypothetical protein QOI12_3688 [Alphaproteobacteria bacterium]|jgi:hypothetical protein|nr:hypothetical protein [Alphaproteobacteria bacterium]
MSREKKLRWLDAACLGRSRVSRSRIQPDTSSIPTIVEGLAAWTRAWVGMPNARVGLCGSTTAACDAALLAMGPGVKTFVRTSGAHPTIQSSVDQAARNVLRYTGYQPPVGEVELRTLCKTSASLCAEQFVNQVLARVGNEPAILVVEQVTYKHGLRLPLEAIVPALRAVRPHLRIVVDSAQAVGLWPPTSVTADAFVGCWHKAAGGPPATGFLALDPAWTEGLPSHLGVLGELPDRLHMLPTLDLEKWRHTLLALQSADRRGGLAARQQRVCAFNASLVAGLGPIAITLGSDCDLKVRSHISAVQASAPDAAEAAVEDLLSSGFVVQSIGALVRISAGPDVRPEWGSEVGQIIRGRLE